MWLSPEFTREEGSIVASAAAAWNRALGTDVLKLYWGTQKLERDQDGQNVIYKSKRVGGDATHYAALTTEGVYLRIRT